jgi:hypothetical protein
MDIVFPTTSRGILKNTKAEPSCVPVLLNFFGIGSGHIGFKLKMEVFRVKGKFTSEG